jgi:hypothetical protein
MSFMTSELIISGEADFTFKIISSVLIPPVASPDFIISII